MSVIISLIRNDFVAFVADRRCIRLDGTIKSEESIKVYRLDDNIIMAHCGIDTTSGFIKDCLDMNLELVRIKRKVALSDYVSMLNQIVRDISEVQSEMEKQDMAATIFVGGIENGIAKFYVFSTINYTKPQVIVGSEAADIYITPPLVSMKAECDQEMNSILEGKPWRESGYDPELLIEDCKTLIRKIAPECPYINDRCLDELLKLQ